MAENGTKRRWGRVFPYIVGAFFCLLTVTEIWVGTQWYLSVGTLCVAIIIVIGQRRIFRPSINRTGSEIVCRYLPWYEGNAYLFCLVFPVLGAAMTAAGRDPGNPAWLQFGGIVLLCVAVLLLWSVVHVWRRSFLLISPSALTTRSGTLGSKLTEIRREQIESITPMIVTSGISKSLQVKASYHASNTESDETQSLLLGPHLTVKPINLANALIAWDDAAIDDPHELLDLIERVLRAKSVGDVTPPPSRSALDPHRDVHGDDSGHE